MNLTDPQTLKPFLAKHGVTAKKGLGQHFLTSSRVVNAICDAVSGCAAVLEIGPRPGILTGPLGERVDRVVALEIDERMPILLAESAPNAKIILGDALIEDLGAILKELPEPRAVVSNLPYYITGPLLEVILQARDGWDSAVLMTQREVGEKILAPVGDRNRGALSVFVELMTTVTRVCNVPPGAFLPPPKLESVVLQFHPTPIALPDRFQLFLHQGFAQPRKTLANNLLAAGYRRELVEECGLDAQIRPHQVSLASWQQLHAQSR